MSVETNSHLHHNDNLEKGAASNGNGAFLSRACTPPLARTTR